MNRFFNTSFLVCLALVCMCTAAKFNANDDVTTLHDAISGKKVNQIGDVLSRRSADQRLEIAQAYEAAYNLKLETQFGFVPSGPYKNLLVALVTPLPDYYAQLLVSDIDSSTIVEIFTTLSNADLQGLDEAYKRLRPDAKSNLQEFVLEKKLLTNAVIGRILKGLRDEGQEVNREAARADARTIHDIGEGKDEWTRTSTDEQTVENIFITRSYDQLSLICTEYNTLYGHGIEKAFEGREWSPATEESYLKMIPVMKSIPIYHADLLYKSFAKSNIDGTATRIIVGSSKDDIKKIKSEFHRMKQNSVQSRIGNVMKNYPQFRDYYQAILNLLTI